MTFETDALSMLRGFPGVGSVSVSTPHGTFDAILNEGFAEAALGPGVEGTEPYLDCRTGDVERLRIGKGTVLRLGERVLKVVRHEPDGTGMSRVIVQ